MGPIKQRTKSFDEINKDALSQSSYPVAIILSFVMLSFITMTDRSIIAGGSVSFAAFCRSAPDAPGFVKENPDVGIGLLTSAFMGGYSAAILFAANLTHYIKWKYLILSGLGVWIAAVWLSGIAGEVNSFMLLLTARIISGVSEASFQVVAPPFIEERGGKNSGLFLSLFLGTIPVALGFGYVYGAFISNEYHWKYCYYFMAAAAMPLFFYISCLTDKVNNGILVPPKETYDGKSNANKFTVCGEIAECLRSKNLLAIVVADSIQMASITCFATFGGSLILALGLFTEERTAASFFGLVAGVCGCVATPLGGVFVDLMLENIHEDGNPELYSSRILVSILPKISVAVGLSVFFFAMITMPDISAAAFMAFYFTGLFFILTIQSPLTTCTLHSVAPDYRPVAIAFKTLLTHLIGDVPAPILFGLLKDELAPSCTIDADHEFINPEGCEEQKGGILIALGVLFTYFGFSIIFFELAHYFAWTDVIWIKTQMAKTSFDNDSAKTVASSVDVQKIS